MKKSNSIVGISRKKGGWPNNSLQNRTADNAFYITFDILTHRLDNFFSLILAVSFVFLSSYVYSDVHVTTVAEVIVNSGTGESAAAGESTQASATIGGQELALTPCGRVAGRNSAASGSATSEIRRQGKDNVSVYMSTSVSSSGGHYRSCGTCAFNFCIDIKGNDTKATAKSIARSTVEFELPQNQSTGKMEQVVTVLTPETADAAVSVEVDIVGAESIELPARKGVRRFLVSDVQNELVRLDLEMSAEAKDEGECCSEDVDHGAVFTIGIQNAALLESKLARLGPRMVYGDIEPGFPAVGLLEKRDAFDRLTWAPHCSGMLIDEQYVLTAAHCVVGIDAPNDLRYMVGNSTAEDAAIRHEVLSSKYPTGGEDDLGLAYSPNGYVDDVALLRLKGPVEKGDPDFAPHAGNPTHEQMKDQEKKIVFVGFGAAEPGIAGRGAGVKRRLELPIGEISTRSFANTVLEGRNTCNGDSGAPGFFRSDSGALVTVGVVSKGDLNCMISGHNSRIDYYDEWIRAHAK